MKKSLDTHTQTTHADADRQKIATELVKLLAAAQAEHQKAIKLIRKVKNDVEQALKQSPHAEGQIDKCELTPEEALKKLKTHLEVRKAAMVGIDLSGTDLGGMNLSGMNLQGANLSRCNLDRCILTNTNLRGANMRGCRLHEARIEGADMTGADLSGSDLCALHVCQGIILDGANIKGTPHQKRLDEAEKRRREEAERKRNNPCIPPNHW